MHRKKYSLQLLLIRETAPDVCEEVGLAWSKARALFEAKILSFNPSTSKRLTEAQAKELRFLGVVAKTCISIDSLKVILAPLERPYAYSTAEIYYSWHRREWLKMPEPMTVADVQVFVETLTESHDAEKLTELRDLIHDALGMLE